MIKILINAPKGGVGKTTLATNIAIYLAEINLKVWALDLAQGEQMTRVLRSTNHFDDTQSGNKVDTREFETIPETLSNEENYDILIADTDDYFKIIEDISNREVSNEWIVLVPIMDEYNGLQRIPEEISSLLITYMFTGNSEFKLKIVPNKIDNVDSIESITNKLSFFEIASFLSEVSISKCSAAPPFYIRDQRFREEIRSLLEEIEVI